MAREPRVKLEKNADNSDSSVAAGSSKRIKAGGGLLPRVKNVDPRHGADAAVDSMASHAAAVAARKRKEAKAQREKEAAEHRERQDRLALLLGEAGDQDLGATRTISKANDLRHPSRTEPSLLQSQVGGGREPMQRAGTQQSPLCNRRLRSSEAGAANALDSQKSARSQSSSSSAGSSRPLGQRGPHEAKDNLVVDTRRETVPFSFFKVLHSFAGEEASDLPLTAGEILRVRDSDVHEDGWWYGCRTSDGAFGTFPSNFVQACAPPENGRTGPRNYVQSPPHSPGRKTPKLPMALGARVEPLQGSQASDFRCKGGKKSQERKSDRVEEHAAATKVQCIYRGRSIRLELSQKHAAAQTIKDAFKRFHTVPADIGLEDSLQSSGSERSSLHGDFSEKEDVEEDHAASIIQLAFKKRKAAILQEKRERQEQARAAKIIQRNLRAKSRSSMTIHGNETKRAASEASASPDSLRAQTRDPNRDQKFGARLVRMASRDAAPRETRSSASSAEEPLTFEKPSTQIRQAAATRVANRLVADVVVAVCCSFLPISLPNGNILVLKDILDDLRASEDHDAGDKPSGPEDLVVNAVRTLRRCQNASVVSFEIVSACTVSLVPELARICLDAGKISPHTRCDAAMILNNIIAEHPDAAQLVVHKIPQMGAALLRDGGEMNSALLSLVGNMAGSSTQAKDAILKTDSIREAIESIVADGAIGSPALRSAIWTLGNLFRGFPSPVGTFDTRIAADLVRLLRLLRDDSPVLIDLIWTIAFMCEASDMAKVFAAESLPANLTKVAVSTEAGDARSTDILLLGALRALGSLLCSCPEILSPAMLDEVCSLLDHTEPIIQKEVMWISSNAMRADPTMVTYIASKPELWTALRKCVFKDISEVRTEAIFLLHTLLSNRSDDVSRLFAQSFAGCNVLLTQIKCPDAPQAIADSLREAIDDILSWVAAM